MRSVGLAHRITRVFCRLNRHSCGPARGPLARRDPFSHPRSALVRPHHRAVGVPRVEQVSRYRAQGPNARSQLRHGEPVLSIHKIASMIWRRSRGGRPVALISGNKFAIRCHGHDTGKT